MLALEYEKFTDFVTIVGYSNADFAKDIKFRRSTIYIFIVCGCCISWKSKLQFDITLSTTESEYIALTECIREALWIQGLLQEIKMISEKATVFTDSQGAFHISRNPVYHDRTKHIGVKYHFIRLNVLNGFVQVERIHTD